MENSEVVIIYPDKWLSGPKSDFLQPAGVANPVAPPDRQKSLRGNVLLPPVQRPESRALGKWRSTTAWHKGRERCSDWCCFFFLQVKWSRKMPWMVWGSWCSQTIFSCANWFWQRIRTCPATEGTTYMKAFLSKGQAATETHKPTRTQGIERELHQKRHSTIWLFSIAMERSTHF